MLADDVEELMDVVGGMDRDRQLSGVRLARNSAGVQVSTSPGTNLTSPIRAFLDT